MGRRHDDRRVAVIFEPIDQLERRFFQARERKLVVVVFVAVVPGGNAGAAAAYALGQHDDPIAVEIGDVGRPPGIARIRRMALERRAVGDADQVGAERTRFRLDVGRAERLLERGDHYVRPSSSAAANAFSLRCCCSFLNSCNCRATMPL